MENVTFATLFARGEALVKERITGTRKGMPDMPNYLHSFRVAHLLKIQGFNEQTQLAGLLHDLVEDSEMSFEGLANHGFPKDVIDVIRLCTHNKTISHKDRRWMLMVVGLAKADCAAAWAVKLADVFDNVMDSYALSIEREKFMREIKIPVLLSASAHLLEKTTLWQELCLARETINKIITATDNWITEIKQELESKTQLTDAARAVIVTYCDQISALNHGIANPTLPYAIRALHDHPYAKGLKLLMDCSCMDMLTGWNNGRDIRAHYRM